MRRTRFIVIAVVFSIASLAAACGLQDGGDVIGLNDRDGSIPADADVDGTIPDGSTPDGSKPTADSSTIDGALPDSSTPFDAGKPYLCVATPVASCITDCPGATIACGTLCVGSCAVCVGSNYQCDACLSDGGRSVSTCEPEDASAFSECLNGQTRCTCSDQSDCPGPNQTCNGGGCFECGEVDAGNNGSTCKVQTHNCRTDPVHLGQCF